MNPSGLFSLQGILRNQKALALISTHTGETLKTFDALQYQLRQLFGMLYFIGDVPAEAIARKLSVLERFPGEGKRPQTLRTDDVISLMLAVKSGKFGKVAAESSLAEVARIFRLPPNIILSYSDISRYLSGAARPTTHVAETAYAAAHQFLQTQESIFGGMVSMQVALGQTLKYLRELPEILTGATAQPAAPLPEPVLRVTGLAPGATAADLWHLLTAGDYNWYDFTGKAPYELKKAPGYVLSAQELRETMKEVGTIAKAVSPTSPMMRDAISKLTEWQNRVAAIVDTTSRMTSENAFKFLEQQAQGAAQSLKHFGEIASDVSKGLKTASDFLGKWRGMPFEIAHPHVQELIGDINASRQQLTHMLESVQTMQRYLVERMVGATPQERERLQKLYTAMGERGVEILEQMGQVELTSHLLRGAAAEMRPEQLRRQRVFAQASRMQHMLWLPWQVEMVQMFGMLPAQQAFQEAAQAQLAGVPFYTAMGEEPQVLQTFRRMAAREAARQYYRGEGAAAFFGTFQTPVIADIERALGFAEPILTYGSYAAVAEIASRNLFQRGLFFGQKAIMGETLGSVLGKLGIQIGGTAAATAGGVAAGQAAAQTLAGGTAGILGAPIGAVGATTLGALAAAVGITWPAYELARATGLYQGEDYWSQLLRGARGMWGAAVASFAIPYHQLRLGAGELLRRVTGQEPRYGWRDIPLEAWRRGMLAGAWAAGEVPDEMESFQRALRAAGLGEAFTPEEQNAMRSTMALYGIPTERMPQFMAAFRDYEKFMGLQPGAMAEVLAKTAQLSGPAFVQFTERMKQLMPRREEMALTQPYLALISEYMSTVLQRGAPVEYALGGLGRWSDFILQALRSGRAPQWIEQQIVAQEVLRPQMAALGMPVGDVLLRRMVEFGQRTGFGERFMMQQWVAMAQRYGMSFPAETMAMVMNEGDMGALMAIRGMQMVQGLATTLRWGPQQIAQAGIELGRLQPWQQQEYLRSFGLTSPYDWSNVIRRQIAAGVFPQEMARLITHDEFGRPIYYETAWQLQQLQRQREMAMSTFGIRQMGWRVTSQEQMMGLERAYQDWSIPIQRRDARFYADLNLARMGLAIRQLEWNLGLGDQMAQRQESINRQLFELQYMWRREDLATSAFRNQMRYQWQVQDFTRQANYLNLQVGWQLEDIDEAIRYAQGRDRLRLMRQRERLVTMANMQRSDLERAQERARVVHGWEMEDIDKARERLEKEYELRREMLKLDDEARKKSREFAREQLELMRREYEHLKVKRQELEEGFKWEDEMLKARRQAEDQSLAFEKERYALEKKFYDEMMPLQEKYWKQMEQYEKASQGAWLAMNGYLEKFAQFLDSIGVGSQRYNNWVNFWRVGEQGASTLNQLNRDLP